MVELKPGFFFSQSSVYDKELSGQWSAGLKLSLEVSPLVPSNVELCHLSFSGYAVGVSLNALLTSKLKIQCVSILFYFEQNFKKL